MPGPSELFADDRGPQPHGLANGLLGRAVGWYRAWVGLRVCPRLGSLSSPGETYCDVIDGLSQAAWRVGKGDFSVRVTDPERDQLGRLAASFNAMTLDLENLREHERQRAILERDIALGREAQQYLYPRRAPLISQASVWGVTQPARIVSGDLYDFLSFTNTEVGLICADVSGKGTSAALMMANLQAVAHGRLLLFDNANSRPAPDAFVAGLNRDISGRFGDNRYATLFYGEFDSRTQILRYVNAGHTPPILISAEGDVTTLTDGDLPVGMFPDAKFQEHRVTLPAGSSIVVYTDGFSDATNPEGDEFGEERIVRCLTSLPKPIDAQNICKHLAGKIAEWTAGADRFDDTTILVLSVDGQPVKTGLSTISRATFADVSGPSANLQSPSGLWEISEKRPHKA